MFIDTRLCATTLNGEDPLKGRFVNLPFGTTCLTEDGDVIYPLRTIHYRVTHNAKMECMYFLPEGSICIKPPQQFQYGDPARHNQGDSSTIHLMIKSGIMADITNNIDPVAMDLIDKAFNGYLGKQKELLKNRGFISETDRIIDIPTTEMYPYFGAVHAAMSQVTDYVVPSMRMDRITRNIDMGDTASVDLSKDTYRPSTVGSVYVMNSDHIALLLRHAKGDIPIIYAQPVKNEAEATNGSESGMKCNSRRVERNNLYTRKVIKSTSDLLKAIESFSDGDFFYGLSSNSEIGCNYTGSIGSLGMIEYDDHDHQNSNSSLISLILFTGEFSKLSDSDVTIGPYTIYKENSTPATIAPEDLKSGYILHTSGKSRRAALEVPLKSAGKNGGPSSNIFIRGLQYSRTGDELTLWEEMSGPDGHMNNNGRGKQKNNLTLAVVCVGLIVDITNQDLFISGERIGNGSVEFGEF